VEKKSAAEARGIEGEDRADGSEGDLTHAEAEDRIGEDNDVAAGKRGDEPNERTGRVKEPLLPCPRLSGEPSGPETTSSSESRPKGFEKTRPPP